MDIKSALEVVISGGDFDLNDILAKVDMFCANGRLTIAEHDELIAKAREAATPSGSFGDIETRMTNLETEVRAIKEWIANLEGSGSELGGSTTETTVPEFKQPTSAIDIYNTGDRVMYNGKMYESTIDNNAWSPDAYPQGWQEITEEA